MKCIPTYWIKYVQENTEVKECTALEKLQIAYNHTKNWKHVMKNSSSPCIDMYNLVGWDWLDGEVSKNIEKGYIRFYYELQHYQELNYLADFDLETFISNIGGFVGIFLGYSMLQVPDLLGN